VKRARSAGLEEDVLVAWKRSATNTARIASHATISKTIMSHLPLGGDASRATIFALSRAHR
jgi:hypothetical protein